MAYFNFQGRQISYQVTGTGKPVLFLHGFLEDSSMWDNILPHYKSFKTILVDLPCHGESRFKDAICTMKEMALIIDALLISEKIENPHVIGHSMGGYVGLELLKLRPLHLILLHSNFWADSAQKKEDRNRVIEVVKKNHSFFVQEAIPGLFDQKNVLNCQNDIELLIKKAKNLLPSEIASATAGMRDRADNSDLLSEFNIDIIHGENDPIIHTDRMKESLSERNRLSNLHLLKNVGHMSIWEDETTLVEKLNSLLN